MRQLASTGLIVRSFKCQGSSSIVTALERRSNTGIFAPATFQAAAWLRKVAVPALRIRFIPCPFMCVEISAGDSSPCSLLLAWLSTQSMECQRC